MEKNYTLRSFDLGQACFGDEARAQTAKLLSLAGVADAHRLMHYQADGRTAHGFSPVKFLGRKNGFALIGYGEEGMALVEQFAPLVASAWACRLSRPITQHVQQGRCDVRPLPYMLASGVRRLIVQKNTWQAEALKADARAYLTRLIEKSFQRQADCMGLTLPEGLTFDVLNFADTGAHKYAGGKAAAAIYEVTFTANAAFDGIWSLGLLTSHGFGLYQPALERAAALGRKAATYVPE